MKTDKKKDYLKNLYVNDSELKIFSLSILPAIFLSYMIPEVENVDVGLSNTFLTLAKLITVISYFISTLSIMILYYRYHQRKVYKKLKNN